MFGMNFGWLVVLLSLGSALLLALAAVLQRQGSKRAPSGETRELTSYIARSPVWLGGFAATILSFLLQAFALSIGSLVVVQSIVRIRLVFLLFFVQFYYHRKLESREVTGTFITLLGIAGFLIIASPGKATDTPELVTWVYAGIAGTAVFLASIIAAQKSNDTVRAASLGVASGLAFAFAAALIKVAGSVLAQGFSFSRLLAWPIWALMAVGAVALLLQQKALRKSAITVSQTATAVTNLLGSVLLGFLLFEESIRGGILTIVGMAAAFAMAANGIYLISSSEAVRSFQK